MTVHPSPDVPADVIRSSLSTRIMTRLLCSAWGRQLGRSLVVLRVRGRTTGRRFDLVVQFAALEHGLVIVPGTPETKQWWRNLREPRAIEVLRDRSWHHARGIVLLESDAEYAPARAAYRERWPRVEVPRGQPLVLATWLDERDHAAATSS